MLAGMAAMSPGAASGERQYRFCDVAFEEHFGRVAARVEVLDGAAPYYRISWTSTFRAEGITIDIQWAGMNLDEAAPRASAMITFRTPRAARERLRIEIRRDGGTVRVGGFTLASRDWRAREARRPGRLIYASIPLEDLEALLRQEASIAVVLAREDGTPVDAGRIEADSLIRYREAMAALRPAVREVVADHRNRCPIARPFRIGNVD
jgi:hypothetical protein